MVVPPAVAQVAVPVVQAKQEAQLPTLLRVQPLLPLTAWGRVEVLGRWQTCHKADLQVVVAMVARRSLVNQASSDCSTSS